MRNVFLGIYSVAVIAKKKKNQPRNNLMNDHLELVKTKAWHRINIMRRLKFQLDRKSLQTTYISFIRPLLEYADVVWDNCTQQEANDLENQSTESTDGNDVL